MSAETRPHTSCSEPRWLLSTRWCIYIDILGFSRFWKCERPKAYDSLRVLMWAIHRIATKVYPDDPERLFVHQMGDGFAIVSEFGEASLERPVAIAIALMRCIATTGTFAVAAIAEGDHADIKGCYPQEVTDDSDNGIVRLGKGLMTLSSVMGTAFICAYRLHNAAPPGPFLVMSEHHRDRIPAPLPARTTVSPKGAPLLSVDWLRAESNPLSDLQRNAVISTPSPDALVQTIQDYCARYSSVREKWRRHLRDLLDIEV